MDINKRDRVPMDYISFIHSVYESRELADKAVSERVKQYGGNEDDYEIIKMPLIQEEEK